jgi:predicted outer membrane repeat protein
VECLEDRCVPATITVTALADTETVDNQVTLREAIDSILQGANINSDVVATGAYGSQDTINFAANLGGGTINLLSPLNALTTNVTIQGPIGGLLTLNRASSNPQRLLRVLNGATVNAFGLSFTNGLTAGIGNDGGAVYIGVGSTLNLTGYQFSGNNSGWFGGAIANFGTLNLRFGGFSGNNAAATGKGGAIFNHTGATLSIQDSNFIGNTAAFGGAVFSNGALAIQRAVLSGNTATQGGAINSDGTLFLTNVLVSGNNATSLGGGLVCFGNGICTLTNDTFYHNIATTAGGAIYVFAGTPPVLMNNSLVADNFNGPTPASPRDDIFGAVASASSFNLVTDNTGLKGLANGVNNNQLGTAANPINAGILANPSPANIGIPGALFYSLLSGSPAIDAGSNSLAVDPTNGNAPLTQDILSPPFGTLRIVDGVVDLGALEMQAVVQPIPNQTATAGVPTNVNFKFFSAAPGSTTFVLTSSNQALIPNGDLGLSGSGASRTLTILPLSGVSGTATITVTVTANGQSTLDTFVVTVNQPPPRPPVVLGAFFGGKARRGQTALTVQFDSLVAVLPGAFQLRKKNQASLGFQTLISTATGQTVVTLTYRGLRSDLALLIVRGSLVTANGVALDGDGNGTPGGAFIKVFRASRILNGILGFLAGLFS